VKLLLDTTVWVWSLLEPERLTKRVHAALESADAELWLSPLSVWQLLALIEAGHVVVDADPETWIGEALRAVPVREASLSHEVARRGHRLHVRGVNVSSRLLAATAQVYDLTLVTADRRLANTKELRVLANR
jgi:PIN domain nuclease of toxin-antitoxin system